MPIKREYNKDFFKKWSYDMAYVLGFMFADGNIVRTKRGTHFLAIYTSDRDLLDDMRNAVGSTHMISERKSATGATFRLQIGSKEWFDDVAQWKLFPCKTHRMSMPPVPDKYVGSFVRGYFDGDGNVWQGLGNKNRKTPTKVISIMFTSCSSEFLKSLRSLLHTRGVKGGGLYTVQKGTYSRLVFSTLDALRLHKIMYNMPCNLLLARKRRTFEGFIKERKLRV